MEMVWNQRNIAPPPACTLPYKEKLPFDLKGTKTSLKFIIASLQDQASLETELFLLKKVIYKGNNQFRYDKFFQGLKKIERCLKRWMEGNLLKTLTEFGDTLPNHKSNKETIYVPCQQLGQFVLVRIMGLAAVLMKAVNFSMESYLHMAEQIKLDFFIRGMLFNSALVSRIWVLCRSRVLELCELYKMLKPVTDTLPPSQVPWLPDGTLPVDLQTWLTQFIDHQDRSDWINQSVMRTTDFQSTEETTHNTSNVETAKSQDYVDDIGEAVSRESLGGDMVETGPAKTELETNKGKISTMYTEKELKEVQILDDSTTKVMDKVHNFLAKEIGHPYSTSPRVKSGLERTKQESELGTVNFKRWSKKIRSCKSFAMILQVMRELQISIRPSFMIRGYLYMLKEIKLIRRESASKDVKAGKLVALDMLMVIQRDGLKKRKHKVQGNVSNHTDSSSHLISKHSQSKRIKASNKKAFHNRKGESIEMVTQTISSKRKEEWKDSDELLVISDSSISDIWDETLLESSYEGVVMPKVNALDNTGVPNQTDASEDNKRTKVKKVKKNKKKNGANSGVLQNPEKEPTNIKTTKKSSHKKKSGMKKKRKHKKGKV